jgi:hypothetical protein
MLHALYPPGGFGRAIWYIAYRVRRLPDPAHKISRGIAAGVFTCFTPFFGFHFLIAAILAWMVRGNMLAALLSTFFGNPLTFPFIASVSVELGYDILGIPRHVSLPRLFGDFSRAGNDLWQNFRAIFTDEVTNWGDMAHFFHQVFMPYLVGGLLPGAICGAVAYALSRPLIAAYQKARIARMKKSYEKRRRRAAAAGTRKERET